MQGSINTTNPYTMNAAFSANQTAADNTGGDFSVVDFAKEVVNSLPIDKEVFKKSVLCLPPLLIADKFVNSKMAGKEESSLLKKIANIGDSIANRFNLDGKTFDKINEFTHNNRFTKYFTDSFAAKPRSSHAINIIKPNAHLTTDLASNLISVRENPEYAHLFEDGTNTLTKETKDFIKNLKPKNSAKEAQKLIKAAEELIAQGVEQNNNGIFGGNKLTELRNKLKAYNLQMGKTSLGSAFAKAAISLKNAFTFGGGLFGFMFVSYSLNHAVKETQEAPKGEKLSTFAHLITEEFVGMLTLQAAANIMYNIGGNKYRGMTLENRDALENLVKETNANRNITQEELKIARLKKDLLIDGVDKKEVEKLTGKSFEEAKNIAKSLPKNTNLKFWEKPLKFMGKFLNIGLDEIFRHKYIDFPERINIPVINKSFKFLGSCKLPKEITSFRGIGSRLFGFVRLILAAEIIHSVIQEPVTKLCHKIFGKPEAYLKKESLENGEKEAETKVQEPEKIKPQTNTIKTEETNKSPNNRNDIFAEFKQPRKTPTSTPAAKPKMEQQETIAASKLERKTRENSLYVPSIEVDNSYVDRQEAELNERVEQILQRSDNKIKRISNYLRN